MGLLHPHFKVQLHISAEVVSNTCRWHWLWCEPGLEFAGCHVQGSIMWHSGCPLQRSRVWQKEWVTSEPLTLVHDSELTWEKSNFLCLPHVFLGESDHKVQGRVYDLCSCQFFPLSQSLRVRCWRFGRFAFAWQADRPRVGNLDLFHSLLAPWPSRALPSLQLSHLWNGLEGSRLVSKEGLGQLMDEEGLCKHAKGPGVVRTFMKRP